jgi:hypothetical protein
LLHGTVIEDLAFAHLSKTFCLPVKIKDWAGKRRHVSSRSSEPVLKIKSQRTIFIIIRVEKYYRTGSGRPSGLQKHRSALPRLPLPAAL